MAKIDIEKYLKADLFSEVGLDKLTAEERISFLESFGSVINQRLVYRLMTELSDEKKDKLGVLLEQKSDEDAALGNFLREEVPDFSKMADEEVARYKKELIERFKA